MKLEKKLEHHLNPLHVYCRMIDYLKVPEPVAYRICKFYDDKRKYLRSKWTKRLPKSI